MTPSSLLLLAPPDGAHLLPDGGGKVGNIQLQRVQGGSQLRRNACQGLKEALVEEESSMELAQALCLGTVEGLGGMQWDTPSFQEPKYHSVVPSHSSGPLLLQILTSC